MNNLAAKGVQMTMCFEYYCTHMYKVLTAVGTNEERSQKIADSIASLPGVPDEIEVVLLNVFEEFDVADDMGAANSDDLYDPENFPKSVKNARDQLEEAGINVEMRREHGDPAETICAVAREIGADSIALAGRKRSPAGKVLFGSVTQSVLLSAERPVIVATE